MNENPTRYRIARWLRAILEGPRATSARPEKLVLRHVTLNERQVDIASFPITQAANDNALDVGDLAMRIEETAHDDAEGLGGLQRYVVHAVVEDRPLSRLPFRISGGGEMAVSGIDDPLDSEPANGRGLLAQGMRHLEAMTRLHAEALGQLVITQQRTISRLAEVNDAGEERRLKAVETAEAMMSDRQERTLKVQESADRTAMLAGVLQTVTPVGPAIVDYLTGAGEKKANDILEMHRELLSRFAKDPDRLEQLLASLSPDERALFEAIFDSVPPPPGESEDGQGATPPGGEGSPAPGPQPPKGAPPPGPPPAPPGGAGPRPTPPRGPSPRPAPGNGAGPRPPGPTTPPRRSRAGGSP